MQRADSVEKTLMLRKIEDKRRKGWQMMRWLNSTIASMDMSLRKLWKIVDREVWHAAFHGVAESETTEQQGKNQLIQQSSCAPWWLKMVKSHYLGHYLTG